MKLNRSIVLVILVLLTFKSANSQCGRFILYTQQDVDSFQANYGPCTTVEEIVLKSCDTCDIKTLRGLREIDFIGELTIEADSIESLGGFNNLKKVDALNFKSSAFIPISFPLLDTINTLTHWFNEIDIDLNLYNRVSHVNRIVVIGNGSFIGLNNFSPHPSCEIIIQDNTTGNTIEPLVKDYRGYIERLTFSKSNLDISILNEFPSLGSLSFVQCVNLDVNPVLDLMELNHFGYRQSQGTPLDFKDGFQNIDTLHSLSILETADLENIESIFPNLKAIKHQLNLSKNQSLNSVNLLSDFPEIERGNLPSTSRSYISISKNPQLETCSNPFICRAVETIPSPDSLGIFLNGEYCNYDSLNVADCITVNNEDHDEELITVYPNPTIGPLHLEGIDQGQYMIFDLLGRTIFHGILDGGEIDLGPIGPGTYFLKIEGGNEVVKFVKE